MNSAIERLLSLRVADVMTDSPVQLSSNASMAEAAKMLQKHRISGAPVADDHGQCVGVLSAIDFVAQMLTVSLGGVDGDAGVLVQDSPGEPYHVETVEADAVRNYMTPEVQSISKESPILDAARIMCSSHIHRLLVLDDQKRSIGVVSSLDLVAAMVKAIEE